MKTINFLQHNSCKQRPKMFSPAPPAFYGVKNMSRSINKWLHMTRKLISFSRSSTVRSAFSNCLQLLKPCLLNKSITALKREADRFNLNRFAFKYEILLNKTLLNNVQEALAVI